MHFSIWRSTTPYPRACSHLDIHDAGGATKDPVNHTGGEQLGPTKEGMKERIEDGMGPANSGGGGVEQ
jgi:hypothetical protein